MVIMQTLFGLLLFAVAIGACLATGFAWCWFMRWIKLYTQFSYPDAKARWRDAREGVMRAWKYSPAFETCVMTAYGIIIIVITFVLLDLAALVGKMFI